MAPRTCMKDRLLVDGHYLFDLGNFFLEGLLHAVFQREKAEGARTTGSLKFYFHSQIVGDLFNFDVTTVRHQIGSHFLNGFPDFFFNFFFSGVFPVFWSLFMFDMHTLGWIHFLIAFFEGLYQVVGQFKEGFAGF